MASLETWYVIPTCNPERAARCLAAWREKGYKTAALVDGDTPNPDADVVLRVPRYEGYYRSVNLLARFVTGLDVHDEGMSFKRGPTPSADIVVTGGDDMFPDRRHAEELAAEFVEHFRFTDGFGVMQPIGDDLAGTANICGSPWFGREWVRRAYSGRGPFWPGYKQFYGDEELRCVAEELGRLWQRPDVAQRHEHYTRKGGPAKTEYQAKNERVFWAPDKALFAMRKEAGWPHHSPTMRPPDGRGLAVVTGAGGFIGHHLVKRLKAEGIEVRGVDLKRPEFEDSPADEFVCADLRNEQSALRALDGACDVYALAADMGGIGFIESHKAQIVRNNTRISLNTLEGALVNGVDRLFFASSACVYPVDRQSVTISAREAPLPLREHEAYPADPEDGYGWEKLYAERLCRHYSEDLGVATRVARFHNIYGPLGTYDGGREKAPAAIARKVAQAPDLGRVEVWGDGKQARTFCYVDDAVEGILRVMFSSYTAPLNVGSEEVVAIDELVRIAARIAEKRVAIEHVPGALGVRGRSADLTLCREHLGWTPAWTLEDGMRETYWWIERQVAKSPAIASSR